VPSWHHLLWPRLKTAFFGRPAAPAPTPPPAIAIDVGLDRSLGKRHLVIKCFSGWEESLADPVRFVPAHLVRMSGPGARHPDGQRGVWVVDTNAAGSAEWIDDLESGFATRQLDVPRDAVGVTGTVGGNRYRIDDILQMGRDSVVYQFTNLNTCQYVAYSVDLEHVDMKYAFRRCYERLPDLHGPDDLDRIVSLARRIREASPESSEAHFNCGMVFMMQNEFAAAHQSFQMALELGGRDVLCLLFDGAALSGAGKHASAVERLLEAESTGSEATGHAMKWLIRLPDLLAVSVNKVIAADPQRADVGQIWLKYFCRVDATGPA